MRRRHPNDQGAIKANKREYSSWTNMNNRCYNAKPENKRWHGRGVKVCDRWKLGEGGNHPFVCFLEDMGRRPTPKHTIDRYPNENGDYEPDNCRWATRKEQAWSKIGKPRPDLAARNRSQAGIPRGPRGPMSLEQRRKLSIARRRTLQRQREGNQNE